MKVEGNIRLKEFKVVSKEDETGVLRIGIITLVSTVNQYDAKVMFGEAFQKMVFCHTDSDNQLLYSSIKIKTVSEKHKLNILGCELKVLPESPQVKALDNEEINKVDVVLKIPFIVDNLKSLATELCMNTGNNIKISLIPSQLELDL